jgi:predicted nucleic acid-binding protein
MIILDTNVISELIDEVPAEAVARWFVQTPIEDMYTTTITEAEIFYGLARLPIGKRKRDLEAVLERLFRLRFRGRVLPFDSAAARNFGDVVLVRKRQGRSYHYADAQIAAIAKSCGAAIATRNGIDFDHCGVKVIDPWTA